MGALKGCIPALLLLGMLEVPLTAKPAQEPPRSNVLRAPEAADGLARWRSDIAEAAARFNIPVAWIEHVMRAESNGQTVWKGAPITSRAGAMGLMQLMPATWAAMRSALGLGDNPHNPRDNILAGTAYLRAMYDRFGYPGLFAAYNAGPGRYGAHLASGRPLPAETRAYVAKVAGPQVQTAADRTDPGSVARQGLFIALRGEDAARQDGKLAPEQDQSPALFVVRRSQ